MKRIMLILAVGVLATLASCKKQGCTDTFADNFDAEAEENDGTCTYSTDLVFYLNDTRYNYYDDKPDFYAPFHLFIDDKKIGELSISALSFQTYESAPDCETTTGGILKYKHSMTSKLGDLTIQIKDQLGNSHGSKFFYTGHGECQAVLL